MTRAFQIVLATSILALGTAANAQSLSVGGSSSGSATMSGAAVSTSAEVSASADGSATTTILRPATGTADTVIGTADETADDTTLLVRNATTPGMVGTDAAIVVQAGATTLPIAAESGLIVDADAFLIGETVTSADGVVLGTVAEVEETVSGEISSLSMMIAGTQEPVTFNAQGATRAEGAIVLDVTAAEFNQLVEVNAG